VGPPAFVVVDVLVVVADGAAAIVVVAVASCGVAIAEVADEEMAAAAVVLAWAALVVSVDATLVDFDCRVGWLLLLLQGYSWSVAIDQTILPRPSMRTELSWSLLTCGVAEPVLVVQMERSVADHQVQTSVVPNQAALLRRLPNSWGVVGSVLEAEGREHIPTSIPKHR
jgi:hypothetical protein